VTFTRFRFSCIAIFLLVVTNLATSSQGPGKQQETTPAQTTPAAYQPQGFVSDYAGLFDAATKARLAALCKKIEKQTNAQFAILTIPSLEGRTSEEFALETFNRWGVGHKEDNRGIMILLVKDDHKYRIEIGLGLEKALPDEKVAVIGREIGSDVATGKIWRCGAPCHGAPSRIDSAQVNQPIPSFTRTCHSCISAKLFCSHFSERLGYDYDCD
jgi:TPM domain